MTKTMIAVAACVLGLSACGSMNGSSGTGSSGMGTTGTNAKSEMPTRTNSTATGKADAAPAGIGSSAGSGTVTGSGTLK